MLLQWVHFDNFCDDKSSNDGIFMSEGIINVSNGTTKPQIVPPSGNLISDLLPPLAYQHEIVSVKDSSIFHPKNLKEFPHKIKISPLFLTMLSFHSHMLHLLFIMSSIKLTPPTALLNQRTRTPSIYQNSWRSWIKEIS